MAASKTMKPSAKAKARPKANRASPAGKKSSAKAVAKAPVKTKIADKPQTKATKPRTTGKTATSKLSIETNPKKSNVSIAAVKKVRESKIPTKSSTVKAPAKTSTASKPAVAKAPVSTSKHTATMADAPSIVLPIKKLPLNGKPTQATSRTTAPPAKRAAQAAAVPQAKAVPQKAQVAPVVDPKKPVKPATQRHGFRTNEYIVYPSHGVGKIVRIEEQVVAGYSLELFVIHFEQEKMTLRVPTAKLTSVGMRKLSESPIVDRAMETLKGRARIKRTMWSRRAQEYEAKINSGDLISIAEVVRDLYRAETQPEQSYSERQLFEAALDRMSREIAAIENLDDRGATQKVIDVLSKSAKSRKAVEAPEASAADGAERAA
ncbi:MAG: CarD family transcriptional regulator [Hyphomicrobiaceae bacterium]